MRTETTPKDDPKKKANPGMIREEKREIRKLIRKLIAYSLRLKK